MLFGINILVLLWTLSHAQDEKIETTILEIPHGPVKGLKVVNNETGKELLEFRGIRYGKAQRFKKPELEEKWTDTFDATEFGAGCPQMVYAVAQDMAPPEISEDCLFLNVYVPIDAHKDHKLPVMFWIHGGGMHLGFSHQYDGGWMATEGNVIIVTINYRLNIFGFLALDHPASKGNYGLWDQILALQWVQQNIEAFGGDPQLVTIYGQSGGAWSTSLLSLIPSNKGLFNRVIAQSGVAGNSNVQSKKTIQDTIIDLANKTACPSVDMNRFVDCLREKSMDDLVKVTDFMSSLPTDKLIFGTYFQPGVDGDLFRDQPVYLLQDKNSEESKFFNSLDFLAGTTSNEGAFLFMQIMPQVQKYYGFNATEGIPTKFVRKGMIDSYVDTFFNNDPDVKAKLYDFYEREDLAEQSLMATYFMSDVWFNFATIKMLEFHQFGKAKTFQYVFSKSNDVPLYGQPPAWVKGVGHGEEVRFMFDLGKIMPSMKGLKLSDEDKILAKRIIHYWSSFAKTGQPDAGEDTVSWKPYQLPEKAYLDIDAKVTVKTNWKKEMYKFWFKIYQTATNDVNVDRVSSAILFFHFYIFCTIYFLF